MSDSGSNPTGAFHLGSGFSAPQVTLTHQEFHTLLSILDHKERFGRDVELISVASSHDLKDAGPIPGNILNPVMWFTRWRDKKAVDLRQHLHEDFERASNPDQRIATSPRDFEPFIAIVSSPRVWHGMNAKRCLGMITHVDGKPVSTWAIERIERSLTAKLSILDKAQNVTVEAAHPRQEVMHNPGRMQLTLQYMPGTELEQAIAEIPAMMARQHTRRKALQIGAGVAAGAVLLKEGKHIYHAGEEVVDGVDNAYQGISRWIKQFREGWDGKPPASAALPETPLKRGTNRVTAETGLQGPLTDEVRGKAQQVTTAMYAGSDSAVVTSETGRHAFLTGRANAQADPTKPQGRKL